MIRTATQTILLVLLFSICHAQNNAIIDSLKNSLREEKDSSEVNTLNKLSFELAGDNNADAIKYASKALDFSENLGYRKGMATANYHLGLAEYFQSNNTKSLELYHKALDIYKEINDKLGIAKVSNSIGVIYDSYTLYDKALENYLFALKIFEELNFERGKANCYNNIALIYHNQKRFKESIEYQRKALIVDLKNNKRDDAAISYLNIADTHMDLGEYDKALSYYDSVITPLREVGYKYALSNALSLFAGLNYKVGNYSKSLELYQETSKVLNEVNYVDGIALNHINTAEVYYKLGKIDVALLELNKAIELIQSKKSKNRHFAEAYNLLSEIYKNKGDYKKSLEYYKEYTKLIDAIQQSDMSERLLSYQTLYETEAKENQIKLLNKDNELKESKINRQLYIILTIILTCFFLIFLVFVIYTRSKNRKRNNEILTAQNLEIQKQKQAIEEQNKTLEIQANKLKEQDELKTNFFSNISHEFRTPLTLILGPLQSLLDKQIDSIQKEQLSIIQRNAVRLQQLINQLLDISKIEKGFVGLNLCKEDICEYTRYLVSSFHSHATERNINLTFESSTKNHITLFDKDKIEKIFFNLLSNAFKYTPNGGSIEVSLSISDKVILSISDTGIGIAKEKLPFIFDKYYQADSTVVKTYESTGIGLALTKELVTIHLGEIHVVSELGIGSTFTVKIPLNYDGFEYNLADENQSRVELIELTESTKDIQPTKTDYTILVIDDNDDMRKFIIGNLDKEYEVFEAKNGKLGVDTAFEVVPDIIISDVMMPEMDGFQVTRTLKNDKRTSHIPIILLTARSTVESRITGLEAEADDYLTKPFYIKELKTRIANILKNRQKLRDAFGSSINISPSEITVTSIDEQFISKALEVVENNMDNPNFDIEEFCEQMGMSRTNLHRKLKAITNKSATEFIRSIRIKRAAQLIKQKAGSISEIAYMVGFNNLSYFTRCFKEDIGINPSEYN